MKLGILIFLITMLLIASIQTTTFAQIESINPPSNDSSDITSTNTFRIISQNDAEYLLNSCDVKLIQSAYEYYINAYTQKISTVPDSAANMDNYQAQLKNEINTILLSCLQKELAMRDCKKGGCTYNTMELVLIEEDIFAEYFGFQFDVNGLNLWTDEGLKKAKEMYQNKLEQCYYEILRNCNCDIEGILSLWGTLNFDDLTSYRLDENRIERLNKDIEDYLLYCYSIKLDKCGCDINCLENLLGQVMSDTSGLRASDQDNLTNKILDRYKRCTGKEFGETTETNIISDKNKQNDLNNSNNSTTSDSSIESNKDIGKQPTTESTHDSKVIDQIQEKTEEDSTNIALDTIENIILEKEKAQDNVKEKLIQIIVTGKGEDSNKSISKTYKIDSLSLQDIEIISKETNTSILIPIKPNNIEKIVVLGTDGKNSILVDGDITAKINMGLAFDNEGIYNDSNSSKKVMIKIIPSDISSRLHNNLRIKVGPNATSPNSNNTKKWCFSVAVTDESRITSEAGNGLVNSIVDPNATCFYISDNDYSSNYLNIVDYKDRIAYDFIIEEKAKLIGLIPINFERRLIVDTNTGDLLEIQKPFWSFLIKQTEIPNTFSY